MMKLLESIKLISDGTFASLTNKHYMSEIEVVRNNFIKFSEELPIDMTWQTAWNIHTKTNRIIETMINSIKTNAFRDYDDYLRVLQDKLYISFTGEVDKNVFAIIEKNVDLSIKDYCINSLGIDDVEVVIGNVFYCTGCNTYSVELIKETCECPKCKMLMII